MSPALIITLVVLSALGLAATVFSNAVSVLWATFVLFVSVLIIVSILYASCAKAREKIKKIEKVDLLGKLRGVLVKDGGFSIKRNIQHILILVMSAVSVAVIVWAIIFVVKALTEFGKTESWDNMDWLLDLMSDIPLLNIMVLMKQGFETSFRAEFFIVVMLLSLVILGFAATAAQVLMAQVYRAIYEEATEGALPFRILAGFSITTLTVTVSLLICRLVGLLLNFSEQWDGFDDFCSPFLSSSAGSIILQALVGILLVAGVLLTCFGWVQDLVLGVWGFVAWFLFEAILSSFFGANSNVTSTFIFLLGILFPIIDYINSNIRKIDGKKWVSVAIPLALSVVIAIVATIIDKAEGLCQIITIPVACIGILFFAVYLLAMPGIDIIRKPDEQPVTVPVQAADDISN